MSLDWKWTLVQARDVPEGKPVVLKMANPQGTISYAIATIEDGTPTYLARQDENATLIVSWMALPN